jgi:hypothetical protein
LGLQALWLLDASIWFFMELLMISIVVVVSSFASVCSSDMYQCGTITTSLIKHRLFKKV